LFCILVVVALVTRATKVGSLVRLIVLVSSTGYPSNGLRSAYVEGLNTHDSYLRHGMAAGCFVAIECDSTTHPRSR
jgi:hypothetical protein